MQIVHGVAEEQVEGAPFVDATVHAVMPAPVLVDDPKQELAQRMETMRAPVIAACL